MTPVVPLTVGGILVAVYLIPGTPDGLFVVALPFLIFGFLALVDEAHHRKDTAMRYGSLAYTRDDTAPERRKSTEAFDDWRAILDFEEQHPAGEPKRSDLICKSFGVSETRYAQRLHQIIVTPKALVHNAMLVNRLRRIADARTAERTARLAGGAR